jgi:hypothetical protein
VRLAALLLVAATAAGAVVPVGNPPLIGGSVDGLLFDGSHFALLQPGLRTMLADDGTLLSSSDDGDRAALASSGRGTLAVSISGGNAYANGLPLGPADAAAAAWDGTHYAVAWRDSGRLRLQFFGDNGGVNAPVDIASGADSFALAARDGTTLVAWSSAGALFARTAAGAAVRIGDGVVSDAAAGRDGFLVTTISGGTLVAQHLDVEGHPDASYTIAPSTRGARVTRERYAYALVWPDGNELLGERIDPFGGTMHGPFVAAALDHEIDTAAIAATGATTLVAYASASLGAFAKPIDDTAPGKPLPAHRARQSAVHAAGSFVVWQQETAGGSEIRVDDHVAAAGTLEHVVAENSGALIVYRDVAGVWSLDWPAAGPPSRFPFDILGPDQQVASNGGESLRVWNDGGAIVAEPLAGGERIVVDGSPAQKGTPHVRWDGAAWVVSWPEIVDASTAGFASMRLGGTKTILAAAALPISLTDWSGTADAVFYVRGGRLYLQRIDAPRRRAAGR